MQISYGLLSARFFVNNVGNLVPITLSEKIIYTYMKERWITFNRNGDEFLDTVNEIAEALNVDRKTVMSTIKKLTENGVVEGYKGRLGSSNKWIWNNFNEFTLRG